MLSTSEIELFICALCESTFLAISVQEIEFVFHRGVPVLHWSSNPSVNVLFKINYVWVEPKTH